MERLNSEVKNAKFLLALFDDCEKAKKKSEELEVGKVLYQEEKEQTEHIRAGQMSDRFLKIWQMERRDF